MNEIKKPKKPLIFYYTLDGKNADQGSGLRHFHDHDR